MSGGSIGTCILKSEPIENIVIFVSPEYEETDGVGTYNDPLGNIVKALSVANERAADMTGGEVSISIILIGGGSHYMTNNINHYDYSRSKGDKYSYNKRILIQPAFCGQTYGLHTFGSFDSDCIQSGEQITVYYKMANSFYFLVPNSLTIKNVIFDAIDSSIDPYDDCLKENTVWCVLDGVDLIENWEATTTPDCTMFYYQEEKWYTTYGHYLFYFGFDIEGSSTVPGTLTIQNSIFRNFLYDFTSLIGLNDGNGHIVITNSTFEKFSNWGSIIRDTRELPTLAYGSTSYSRDIRFFFRASTIPIKMLKSKYLGVAKSTWVSSVCSSITISGSTFSDFNYLKNEITYNPNILQTSSMTHQGVILDLINFYGPVTLTSNTLSVKFKYAYCDVMLSYDSNQDFTIFNSSDPTGNSFVSSMYQGKTLIYIRVKK